MKIIGGLNSDTTLADITSVVAGTGLSGGGTTGAVTLNVDAAQTQITSLGTIGTGTWQGDVIASAYLDSDTAHLSSTQSFTGLKTFLAQTIFDGNRDVTPGDGAMIHVDACDITDAATSASGTAAKYTHVNIESPRLLASSVSVTTTDAATLYVKNAAVASTNQTITNNYALWVDDGDTRLDGNVTVNSTKIEVSNTTTSSAIEGGKLNLISDDGAALGDDHQLGKIGFRAAEDASGTLKEGASIRAFADAAWSGLENGTRLEFYTMDGNALSELSLTLDSDLLATFAGAVTVTGALTGTLATASQPNITTVGTIGTGVWNGTKITDIYTNSSGKRYGSTIKILPQDFMVNDDAASPLSFKDGSNSGVMVNDTSSEMIAFVTIPEGMKATALDIYSTNNKNVSIYEVDLNSSFDFSGSGPGANETGSANTQITIDPAINATATNILAIIYTATATSNRVWGGLLTIAPQ